MFVTLSSSSRGSSACSTLWRNAGSVAFSPSLPKMSMKLGGVFATSSSNRSSTRPDSVPSGAVNSPVPNRPPYPIEKIRPAIERMDATRTSHLKRYTRRPQAANTPTLLSQHVLDLRIIRVLHTSPLVPASACRQIPKPWSAEGPGLSYTIFRWPSAPYRLRGQGSPRAHSPHRGGPVRPRSARLVHGKAAGGEPDGGLQELREGLRACFSRSSTLERRRPEALRARARSRPAPAASPAG